MKNKNKKKLSPLFVNLTEHTSFHFQYGSPLPS